MKIETWAYGPVEKETVSQALATERVVRVKKNDDGTFEVREMCDEWFGATLTADQLKAWGRELIALAESSLENEKGQP